MVMHLGTYKLYIIKAKYPKIMLRLNHFLLKSSIFAKYPIFSGQFPLFATLPPFRNTFLESLGVAKRDTTGVI